METPVIYFYSPKDESVRVDVDFPGGLITQWYPQATTYSPAVGEASSVSGGHVRWDVRISSQAMPVPSVAPGSIWLPSRQTRSNDLSAYGESEKMIFYRGLGHFDTQLKIASTETGGLELRNMSVQTIPAAFLISVSDQGGSVTSLGPVPARDALKVSATLVNHATLEPIASYVEHAKSSVREALIRSGLYSDESQAMVETWAKSYFRTPGLRVLYILPREWTDHLLPIDIKPTPEKLVRTLVGRIEVMTRAEEDTLVSRLERMDETGMKKEIDRLGRFAEPKLRRALTLAKQHGAVPRTQALIQSGIDLSTGELQ
jgi:hypothetical protein